MGEGNHAEFGAAREGRERRRLLRADAAGIASVGPSSSWRRCGRTSATVDAAVLTGELAEHLLASMSEALAPGVDGWVDDDFAFLAPWGFDVGAIGVPVLRVAGRGRT